MKEIVVISGKGGTGKTSVLSSLAALSEKAVLCDADVDAADLHLLTRPRIRFRKPFIAGHTAVIDKDKCVECGTCREMCRFGAVDETFFIDPVDCEGCGVCVHFCPESAIDFPNNVSGEWYVSDTRFGPMVHARLGIGEENSGKLVAHVRKEAGKLGESEKREIQFTDGPPGIGCPVIAAIGGADAVLAVTEPTVSGVTDLKRVLGLADHFNVPAMIVINKCDLNEENTKTIRSVAREVSADIIGEIRFDPAFTKAMIREQSIVEYDLDSEAAGQLKKIYRAVRSKVAL